VIIIEDSDLNPTRKSHGWWYSCRALRVRPADGVEIIQRVLLKLNLNKFEIAGEIDETSRL
jgi:hypothetical protein